MVRAGAPGRACRHGRVHGRAAPPEPGRARHHRTPLARLPANDLKMRIDATDSSQDLTAGVEESCAAMEYGLRVVSVSVWPLSVLRRDNLTDAAVAGTAGAAQHRDHARCVDGPDRG